MTWNFF